MDTILNGKAIRSAVAAFVLFPALVLGQNSEQIDSARSKLKEVVDVGFYPKSPPKGLYNFALSGEYRFFGTYLALENPYILQESPAGANLSLPRTLFIGDDSQLPNFTLRFSGMPSSKVIWDFDLYAFQFLEGDVGTTYGGQILQENRPSVFNPIITTTRPGQSMGMLLGIRTNAAISTPIGTIGATLGGSQWVSISDLTMASFRGYNRFLLFERNPWDPVTAQVSDRYEDFYSFGNINQDDRWGERVFNGLTIRANDLPADIELLAMYGKTELNGGLFNLPNESYGGKLTKTWFGHTRTSFNTINSSAFIDSAGTSQIQMNVLTGQVVTSIGKIAIDAEIGAGKYEAGTDFYDWGEAINVKVKRPFWDDKILIELQGYRIDPNVVNNNGIFWNISRFEPTLGATVGGVGAAGASPVLLRPLISPIVPIGLTTNNRQGFNINADIELGDFKFSVANGIAEELEGLDNLISFSHPVNQLTRSRFWRWTFPANVGPYGRQNDIFRETFEVMELTDDSLGNVIRTKKFNVLELQMRYKTKLFHRDLYIFGLNRYSSVQPEFAPITVFTTDAYLRHYTNEIEIYYALAPRLTLSSYFGYERILGNNETELSLETGLPRDQVGRGIGFGFDVSLGRNAALYARHRFFDFEDRSFVRDQFSGQETVLELKVAF